MEEGAARAHCRAPSACFAALHFYSPPPPHTPFLGAGIWGWETAFHLGHLGLLALH